MMLKRSLFNPKRKIMAAEEVVKLQTVLERLAADASYAGHPDHKSNPGDFGLTPASSPRPNATLCDAVKIFKRKTALELLRSGIRRGLVSEQHRGCWPQNVWAVTQDNVPLEAELQNQASGEYHGYPMLSNDPFREEVLKRWGVNERR